MSATNVIHLPTRPRYFLITRDPSTSAPFRIDLCGADPTIPAAVFWTGRTRLAAHRAMLERLRRAGGPGNFVSDLTEWVLR